MHIIAPPRSLLLLFLLAVTACTSTSPRDMDPKPGDALAPSPSPASGSMSDTRAQPLNATESVLLSLTSGLAPDINHLRSVVEEGRIARVRLESEKPKAADLRAAALDSLVQMKPELALAQIRMHQDFGFVSDELLLLAKGVAYLRLNRHDAAKAAFLEAELVNPDGFLSPLLQGVAAFQKGRDQEAEVALNRALSRSPSSPVAKLYLGETCFRAGRYVEAKALFSSVLQTDAKNQLALFNLALTYRYGYGDEPAAQLALNKMLADPVIDARMRQIASSSLRRHEEERGALSMLASR